MSAATIRPYAAADEAAVIALVRELQAWEGRYFDRMTPPDQIGRDYIERLHADCAKDDGVILVAEDGAGLIGYATVFTGLDSAEERDEVFYRFAYVGDLVVTERARGTGAGKALLRACEDRARRAGRRWLRIGVLADNARALGVYRSFGFRDTHVQLEKTLD